MSENYSVEVPVRIRSRLVSACFCLRASICSGVQAVCGCVPGKKYSGFEGQPEQASWPVKVQMLSLTRFSGGVNE